MVQPQHPEPQGTFSSSSCPLQVKVPPATVTKGLLFTACMPLTFLFHLHREGKLSGSWGGDGAAVCSWMLNQSKKPFPANQAWVTLQHLRDVFLAANINTNAPRMPTTLTKTYFKPRTILHQTNTPFPTADLVFLLIWRILLHCSVPSIFLLTSPSYLDDGRRDFI